MAFSESLTVRILGDSSGLRRELGDVIREISQFQERITSVTSGANQLGRSLSGISAAIRPLQQVSQWLSRITQQVQALSRSPVSLNVQPALQSLQQLVSAAQAAANMLRSLSVGPIRPMTPVAPVLPDSGRGTRRFAAGGLVTGPSGLDRVATQLTAGEYVLNQTAVHQLGTAVLDRLNSVGERAFARGSTPSQLASNGKRPVTPGTTFFANTRSDTARPGPRAAPAGRPDAGTAQSRQSPPYAPVEQQTTNNHFGGITIQVRETADVAAIVRDLRLQGIHLRNRRG